MPSRGGKILGAIDVTKGKQLGIEPTDQVDRNLERSNRPEKRPKGKLSSADLSLDLGNDGGTVDREKRLGSTGAFGYDDVGAVWPEVVGSQSK